MGQTLCQKPIVGAMAGLRRIVKSACAIGVLGGAFCWGLTAHAVGIDSMQAMFGEDVRLQGITDISQLPEEKEILTLPHVTEQEVKSYALKPLPPVKRPAENTDQLSHEEQNFCILVLPLFVEEVEDLNPHCTIVTEYMHQALLNFTDYNVLVKALNVYRMKHEHNVSEDMYDTVYNRKANSILASQYWKEFKAQKVVGKGEQMPLKAAAKCVELNMIVNTFKELNYIGYDIKKTNDTIDLFNERCAGRKVAFRELIPFIIKGENIWATVDPVIDNGLHETIGSWSPKTYLAPKSGSAEQQKPEIKEAQELLTKLGFFKGKANGFMDLSTSKAISAFEHNLGLKQTGKLSFSNLMRMRLYTVGYDPQYLVH